MFAQAVLTLELLGQSPDVLGAYHVPGSTVYAAVDAEPPDHPTIEYYDAKTQRLGTLVHVTGDEYRSDGVPALTFRLDAPAGMAPIQTNIAGGAYVVQISGLRWLGRNPTGFAVVQRLKNGKGPVNIVVSTAHTAAMVWGSILSIVAIVMLAAILIYTAVRPRLRRSGAVDPPPAAGA